VTDGGLRVDTRQPSMALAVTALAVPVAVSGIPGHTDSMTWIAAEVGVLTVLVGIVGFESTAPGGLLAVVTSVLSLNGFAEDQYGELGWHPGVDLRVTAVLGVAWAIAFAARRGVDQRLSRQPPNWSEEPEPKDGIDERHRLRRADPRGVRPAGTRAAGG
jgi:hypothetical protein